jgi:hypothetical protein
VRQNNQDEQFREVGIPLTDFKKLSTVLQALCEHFKIRYTRDCCIYSLTGLLIQDDDIDFI